MFSFALLKKTESKWRYDTVAELLANIESSVATRVAPVIVDEGSA